MGCVGKGDSVILTPWNNPICNCRWTRSIKWADIEALLVALGAELSEGSGSRIRITLNGVRAVFHRPHPQPTTDKGAVKSMRRFLTQAGIKP